MSCRKSWPCSASVDTTVAKIRVLIVDDSVVIRRLLSVYLASDPQIEVVGTAANGEIGLAKIAQLNPDAVILDIEMPVMDGLKTLAAIRKVYKKLSVIMFSTLTERGAVATLDALALGASDYATKSITEGGVREHIATDLIPKIKTLCHCVTPPAKALSGYSGSAKPQLNSRKTSSNLPVEILAIGTSTGGPNALSALFAGLSPKFPVPIVIVQHMPKIFTRLLAERLSAISGFKVREGEPGALLTPGEVWVAPGGFHMDLVRTAEGVKLRTHEGPLENSCRPAVDVLFRSVAELYRATALGVILTGMGQDGLIGSQSIVDAGGRIIAQDEASSVVWGMPGAVSNAGLPEKILPLMDMANEINRIVAVRGRLQESATSISATSRNTLQVQAI